jgi:hypothetical protein
MISGFSFIHNAFVGGYPIFEAIEAVRPHVDELVIADMRSDDGTREALESLPGVRVVDGLWIKGDAAGCLQFNHALHAAHCRGDVIIHFEADEVYDDALLEVIRWEIARGNDQLAVYRLQVEQNFQRIRWYPELVHRVFKNGTPIKVGHTTDIKDRAYAILPEFGFLWDVTNCFRDQWIGRIRQQAELWPEENRRAVGLHAAHGFQKIDDVDAFLSLPHWTWTATPLNIPAILRPLVGVTNYQEYHHAKC